ncbi:hypothetical protein ACJMK2_036706 [Sinanodonta woodiana]|uniref:U4/U6.U5 tri-snRNP-associated protein 1 n=1 Tax=Sinanodonta woodiana TaxID=1069815 RepID=A0ABD3WM71_SINWO
MGSSKKHKEKDREHKKKRKHRSKSRSRSRERYKRRHKEKDREIDVEYDAFQIEREEGELEEERHEQGDGGSGLELSVEETNKLRAQLGLKPLEVNSSSGGNEEKESLKDDVHVPATNMGSIKQTEKLREKVELMKDKRQVLRKLSKVKTLGDSDSDEDSAAWVRKMRAIQKEKDLADKRAKMLEEMDQEFGIGTLLEQEFKPKEKEYTSKSLKGLKVEHDITNFQEGKTVILTLRDRGVLDEEDGETLINVNMIDDEKAAVNVENKKKKPDYNPYDDGEEDEYGVFRPKEVLSKYNEEIEGPKKKVFQLGSGGRYNVEADKQMDYIRQQLRAQAQSLTGTTPNIATEFYTPEEMQTKFRKMRKKPKKIRKKAVLTADELLELAQEEDYDYGSRTRGRGRLKEEPMEEDGTYILPPGDHGKLPTEYTTPSSIPGLDLAVKKEPIDVADIRETLLDGEDYDDLDGPIEDLTGLPVEEEEIEDELQSALHKARKMKQKKDMPAPEKVIEKMLLKQEEKDMSQDLGKGASIVLNSTAEFCRALGEIPTYGQSGNRDEMERDELLDFEQELIEQRRRQEEEEEKNTGWNEVEIDETPVTIEGEEKPVLDDEPVVNQGVGAALQLAVKKGYMQKELEKKTPGIKNTYMLAQNYSIEDKRYDDLDEKYKRRERHIGGALVEFKEKEGYKPEIKLNYNDDTGRMLSEKEAFRQLSHRFHGKGSGKKKTEKRAKKLEEESLMKQMSSTDTPLNTVALLKEKQIQEKTPYIVLSGNKGFTNTIVKANRE